MDGVTLENLRVVFEAQYAGYKKDMDKVKSVTRQVSETVKNEKAKIDKYFNSVSTDKTRKEIDKLQSHVAKSREAVVAQQAIIQNLQKKYQDLMSGVTKDASVSSLEKQFSNAQKELSKLDAQLQPLLDKLTQAEDFETLGLKMPDMEAVRAQIDSINPKYEETERLVVRLQNQLADLKMNPGASTSAQRLQQEISLAELKMERLEDAAASAERELEQAMNPGPKGTIKNKVNQVIEKVKQLRSTSVGSSRQMHGGFDKVTSSISSLKKRITGLIGSALVFNVMSQGLAKGRETLFEYLKTNDQFNTSLNTTKSNLKIAFMPIYNSILPSLNEFMEKLANVSVYLASFTSALFGTTYAESKKAADGITAAADAAAGAGKKLGLASFDELNNLSSSATGSSGATAISSPVNEEAITTADKFREMLEKCTVATEPFRQACSRLWNEGLSDLGKFSWKGLEDFWNEFLLPLGNWAFGTEDKGFTRLVDIINDDLSRVPWDEVNGNLKDFWTAIEPYAEEFGEGLIDFFEDMGDFGTDIFIELFGDGGALTELTGWLNDNDPERARTWGRNLGILAISIAGFSAASSITESISKAKKLLQVLGGLKGIGKVALVVTAAIVGFERGKELGKLLNPEDSDWYDNFSWFGGDGFFETISEDWDSTFNGLITMANDFQNNPAIATLTRTLGGPFVGIPANMALAKDAFAEFKDYVVGKVSELDIGAQIAPYFTKEKWSEMFNSAKEGIMEKLDETVAEWSGGVSGWWDNHIEPWFTKEKWENALSGMPDAWDNIWKEVSISGIQFLNKFIQSINEKFKLEWDAVVIAGQEVYPGGSVQLISIPPIPLPQYKNGGFPNKYSVFMAGENGIPELMGTVGGRTAVAGGAEITGIADAVYSTGNVEASLLQTVVELLRIIANKESGITAQEIYQSVVQSNRQRTQRTGTNPLIAG